MEKMTFEREEDLAKALIEKRELYAEKGSVLFIDEEGRFCVKKKDFVGIFLFLVF